ncbi:MAG: hypothetical protein U9N33_02735, partial [Campylobacterota bacterium]|nr:hypothetical protein [Campylobacterota bacterium]
MATVIGTVESIEGKFFAKDTDGNIIELKVGDTIFQDMIVFGDQGNSEAAQISIAVPNLDNVVLYGLQQQTFDSSLIDGLSDEDGLAVETVDRVLDESLYAEVEAQDAEKEEDDLEETAAGDEEIEKTEEVLDLFATRDGGQTDINTGLRDADQLETAAGDEEIEKTEEGLSQFATRDGGQTDINTGLRDADNLETAAGNEAPRSSEAGESEFDARDGDEVDVNTDLRVASFDPYDPPSDPTNN